MDGPQESKLKSKCKDLASQSYKCLEQNPTNGQQACKDHFESYKECRKAEHNSIVDERRKSGATIR